MLQSKVDHSKCAKHTPNSKHESSRGSGGMPPRKIFEKNGVVRVIPGTIINHSNILFFLSQIIRYSITIWNEAPLTDVFSVLTFLGLSYVSRSQTAFFFSFLFSPRKRKKAVWLRETTWDFSLVTCLFWIRCAALWQPVSIEFVPASSWRLKQFLEQFCCSLVLSFPFGVANVYSNKLCCLAMWYHLSAS